MMYVTDPQHELATVDVPSTMRAVVTRGYGAPDAVLAVREVETPVPEPDEVLVRVRAASVNPADWHIVRGEPLVARASLGVRTPRVPIPGCDLAGRVVATGDAVTGFRPGDEVFGAPFPAPFGAFAEYARVPAHRLVHKPAELTFVRAAALPLAGSTALQAIRDHGRVEPGDRVLIIGASGGVGSCAVQIATALGAEVVGVCGTRNVELVRSLGAQHVIDHTVSDIDEPGLGRFDLVVQLAGAHGPADLRRILAPGGTALFLSGDAPGRWFGPVRRIVSARAVSPFVHGRLTNFTVDPIADDLEALAAMVRRGELHPIVDRTCPLDDVPNAILDVERGHTRGKIVVAC